MANNSQRTNDAGFNFSSQVEHFKVTNAANPSFQPGNRGAAQRGSHWPAAPSMAKAAANAKQEPSAMKRARSFSNNRAFGHGVAQGSNTAPVGKEAVTYQSSTKASDIRKEASGRPSSQAMERALLKTSSSQMERAAAAQQRTSSAAMERAALSMAQGRTNSQAMERAQRYLQTRNNMGHPPRNNIEHPHTGQA